MTEALFAGRDYRRRSDRGPNRAVDAHGRGIAGNFEAQAREAFRRLDLTLNSAGGSLADVVHHDGYGSEALDDDSEVSALVDSVASSLKWNFRTGLSACGILDPYLQGAGQSWSL